MTPPLPTNDTQLRECVAAAEGGCVYSQLALGTCYFDGVMVERDLTRAAAWYQRAADLGDAVGRVNLGGCYFFGQGVPRDVKRAVALYLQAWPSYNSHHFPGSA